MFFLGRTIFAYAFSTFTSQLWEPQKLDHLWLVEDGRPINTTCICNNLRRIYAPMTLYIVQFMNIPFEFVISFHNCHATLL